jgi:hypothetical protein
MNTGAEIKTTLTKIIELQESMGRELRTEKSFVNWHNKAYSIEGDFEIDCRTTRHERELLRSTQIYLCWHGTAALW